MDSSQLLKELTALNELSDEDLQRATTSGSNGLQETRAMAEALFSRVECQLDESDAVELALDELLSVYRRGGPLRVFGLQFVPSMLIGYTRALSRRRRHSCIAAETFLLSIYNEEILSKSKRAADGVERARRVDYVRVPPISTPSVYHDPSKISGATDAPLPNRIGAPSSWDGGGGGALPVVQMGPFPSVERLTATNRHMVLTRLLKAVRAHLAQMHQPFVSLSLCRLATGVCRSGFHFPESDVCVRVLGSDESPDSPRNVFQSMDDYSSQPRIATDPVFLLELLNCVYFALFNGSAASALHAIDAINQRSSFELYPEVLLATNAVVNSLLENPSGVPGADGPMGVRIVAGSAAVESSPSGSARAERNRRQVVTNASLRIRRMPEDIPVRSAVDAPAMGDGKAAGRKEGGGESSLKKRMMALKVEHGKADAALKQSKSELSMEQLTQTQRHQHRSKARLPHNKSAADEAIELRDVRLDEAAPSDAALTDAIVDELATDAATENGGCLVAPPPSTGAFTPRKLSDMAHDLQHMDSTDSVSGTAR